MMKRTNRQINLSLPVDFSFHQALKIYATRFGLLLLVVLANLVTFLIIALLGSVNAFALLLITIFLGILTNNIKQAKTFSFRSLNRWLRRRTGLVTLLVLLGILFGIIALGLPGLGITPGSMLGTPEPTAIAIVPAPTPANGGSPTQVPQIIPITPSPLTTNIFTVAVFILVFLTILNFIRVKYGDQVSLLRI